jgi:competence protein ComEC
VIWAALTPVPDILVGADGRTIAVRGADGRLSFHHTGGDTFATREWLAADADGRDIHDQTLGKGIACDPSGCIGKLADGRLVSHALAPDALEEDCQRTVLIVTARDAPPGCTATMIGRDLWRTRGALALRRDGSGFVMESARPPNYDRPWAPAPLPRVAPTASQPSATAIAPEASKPPPRDATPPAEALDPNE